jgi:hypothetical protein
LGDVHEECGEELHSQEGKLHEFDPLVDFIIGEDQQDHKGDGGEVEDGELGAVGEQVAAELIGQCVEDKQAVADSRPAQSCLRLLPAQELKVQVGLSEQAPQEEAEGQREGTH